MTSELSSRHRGYANRPVSSSNTCTRALKANESVGRFIIQDAKPVKKTSWIPAAQMYSVHLVRLQTREADEQERTD